MGSGFMRWMSQDSEHGGKIHCVFENLVSYRKRETGDMMCVYYYTIIMHVAHASWRYQNVARERADRRGANLQ